MPTLSNVSPIVKPQPPVSSSGMPIVQGTFAIVSAVNDLAKSFIGDLISGIDSLVRDVERDFMREAESDDDWEQYSHLLTATYLHGDLILGSDGNAEEDSAIADIEYGTSENPPNALMRKYMNRTKTSVNQSISELSKSLVPYV